jgi:hypothetical protein
MTRLDEIVGLGVNQKPAQLLPKSGIMYYTLSCSPDSKKRLPDARREELKSPDSDE